MPASEHFFVNGIVSARDNQPYVQLSNEHGTIAQLTMAQARIIAQDILVMCSRSEADAMIIRFFEQENFPKGAAGQLLIAFREFRDDLDNEALIRTRVDPDEPPEKTVAP